MRPQQLEIQQEAELRTDEQKDDRPMIVLGARLSVDRDLARLTVAAAAIITGVDLRPVDHGQPMPPQRPQDLVADQSLVHAPQDGAQARNIEDLGDMGELVGTGHGVAQKPTPRASAAEPVQGIQTGQATEPQDQQRLGKHRRGNLRFDPMIDQGFQFTLQAEDLLPVGDRSR